MAGRDRLRQPPSSVTGELYNYLTDVWRAVNQIPALSYFSGVSPNTSNLTGLPGTIAFNTGSSSSDTRAWIMGGNNMSGATVGWVAIRTLG